MIETCKSKVGYLALGLALGGVLTAGTAYGVDAMFADAAGNEGVGVSSPEVKLHVQTNEGGYPRPFLVDNQGSNFAGLTVQSTGGDIDLNNSGGNTFRINIVDGDGWELQLQPSGDMEIKGALTTGGPSCSGGCDVVLSPGYKLDSIEEHAAKMWAKSFLPAVRPTPESGVAFNHTEKTGVSFSELDKAHIYIEQVNDQVTTLTAENRSQQQTI